MDPLHHLPLTEIDPSALLRDETKRPDTFTDLKLIPKPLSIKDVIWTRPDAVPPAKVAQQ